MNNIFITDAVSTDAKLTINNDLTVNGKLTLDGYVFDLNSTHIDQVLAYNGVSYSAVNLTSFFDGLVENGVVCSNSSNKLFSNSSLTFDGSSIVINNSLIFGAYIEGDSTVIKSSLPTFSISGSSGETSQNGGNINVYAGSALEDGYNGDINIKSAPQLRSGTGGGNIFIEAASAGTNTGNGIGIAGTIRLQSGQGATAYSDHTSDFPNATDGGSINILAGIGGGCYDNETFPLNAGVGGDIFIVAGKGGSGGDFAQSGNGGNLFLESGIKGGHIDGYNGSVFIASFRGNVEIGNTFEPSTIKIISSLVGGLPMQYSEAIASSDTIVLTNTITHITGIDTVNTITPLDTFTQINGGGMMMLIPDDLWSTGTTGNIAIATTAVVGRTLTMTYDNSTSKWYPSY